MHCDVVWVGFIINLLQTVGQLLVEAQSTATCSQEHMCEVGDVTFDIPTTIVGVPNTTATTQHAEFDTQGGFDCNKTQADGDI